jgi:hypothetical protein
MADIVIGRSLDRVRVKLIKASDQSFALAWKDAAGNPADITGITFTIYVETPGGELNWVATKSTNVTTWTLNAVSSNLARGFYGGRLMANSEQAYAVVVEVQ